MLDRQRQQQILAREQARCRACGVTHRPVLVVHHVIPRSLGGNDVDDNLVVLCHNCHRLVHWYSVGRRIEGHGHERSPLGLAARHWSALKELALKIRGRAEAVAAKDSWLFAEGTVAGGSVSLDQALEQIAARNGFEGAERKDMIAAVQLLMQNMPPDVRQRSSIRLLAEGRYLSVNAGNHLVFRVPAYSDGGKRQDADSFVIWPADEPISVLKPAERKKAVVFRFRLFEGENLALSFDEVLALTADDWQRYQRVCRDALTCRKTRNWPSNVTI